MRIVGRGRRGGGGGGGGGQVLVSVCFLVSMAILRSVVISTHRRVVDEILVFRVHRFDLLLAASSAVIISRCIVDKSGPAPLLPSDTAAIASRLSGAVAPQSAKHAAIVTLAAVR